MTNNYLYFSAFLSNNPADAINKASTVAELDAALIKAGNAVTRRFSNPSDIQASDTLNLKQANKKLISLATAGLSAKFDLTHVQDPLFQQAAMLDARNPEMIKQQDAVILSGLSTLTAAPSNKGHSRP